MIPTILTLLALYLLGLLLAGLVGFCDAAGRIASISKGAYYTRAVLRALGWGQLNVLWAFLGGATGLALASDPALYLQQITTAGQAALTVYLGYTLLVGLTFLGYAIPSVEARSFVTVALFGPLTLILPFVVLAGFVAAIWTHPTPGVLAFFAPCVLYMTLFKRILDFFQAWSYSLPKDFQRWPT